MTTDAELGGSSARQPMLTVAAVARRLGVAPSTLRTWDRRYGLGPSAHTAGSHRRYSAADLGRLVVMRGLTLEGVPPAEAAQIALSGPVPVVQQVAAVAGIGPVHSSGAVVSPEPAQVTEGPVVGIPVAREGDIDDALAVLDRQLDRQFGRHLHPGPGTGPGTGAEPAGSSGPGLRRVTPKVFPLWPSSIRPGGGRVMSLPTGSPQARGLARAAMCLDTGEVTRLLRDAIGVYGVVSTWEAMAIPVLQAIGERWRVTGDGVDVEHAFSEAVLGVLRGVTATLRRPRNSRPVLLTCAEGDYHTLPLHVLAAALAEEEVGCRMLGAGMPADALIAAVRRTGPSAVFVYARLSVSNSDVLHELPRQRPTPRVVIGGSGWADVEPPAVIVRVGSLGTALDEVLSAVAV